jgi:hypothetical protein
VCCGDLFGHQNIYVLPDQVPRSIAEDALGSRIDRFNTRAPVDHDNCIHRCIDDGTMPGLTLTQCIFRLLAIGNIFAEDHDAADLSVRAVPGAHFPSEPMRAAVRSQEWVLLGPQHLAAQRTAVNLAPALGNLGENLVV